MIEVVSEQMRDAVSKYGYEFVNFIGFGSSSSVSLCKGKICQQQFAIKRSNKQISPEEYNSLISLSHPNVISLYNVFNDEDYQYLVMEYCSKGTIAQQGKLAPEKFIYYAKQMLEALVYCHSRDISHFNIKPENMLIDQYDHIKLCDFAVAQEFDMKKKSKDKEDFSSIVYSAPEILQHKKYVPFQTDIWALGITFYYMAVGHLPFIMETKEETRKATVFCELSFGNAKIDPQIRFLISKMITKNAGARPSAEKLLKFPIFQSTKYSKKINKLASGGRKNSIGFGSSANFFLTKSSATFEDENADPFTVSDNDNNNVIPLSEVHCYRSVAIHPSILNLSTHHLLAKPI